MNVILPCNKSSVSQGLSRENSTSDFNITVYQLGRKTSDADNIYIRNTWRTIEQGLKHKLVKRNVKISDVLRMKTNELFTISGVGIKMIQILLDAIEKVYGLSVKDSFRTKEGINFNKLAFSKKSLKDILEFKS